MNASARLLQDQPVVLFHLVTMLAAIVLGVVLLLRRKGGINHRLWGWTWVVLIGASAASTVFIRDFKLPNVFGYTPIHLLTIVVAVLLPLGVWYARRHRVNGHRKTMQGLYIGACVVAGAFTLLPGRFLGNLLWQQLA